MTRTAAAQDKSILFVPVAKGAFFGGEWFLPFGAVYRQPQLEGNLHSASKSGIGAILAAGCVVFQESSLKCAVKTTFVLHLVG